ncbi:MAG: Sec-independent protein translocase TatA [Planctomycetaceae bacterium]|nr:Sec-independent protein translocase TatA [Planctomycetaceae bacterium]
MDTSFVLGFLPFGGSGPWELVIVLAIALLLFGKRLPEVARSMGKGIVEFKKGVRGIEEEVERADYMASTSASTERPAAEEERQEVTAPKFEPPKFEQDS